MEEQKAAYFHALLAVFFWSTVATAFKLTLRYLNYLQLLFYSSLTSVFVLFLILLFQGKLGLLKTYSKRDYLNSAVLGFLNPFLYYVVLFKAYSLLKAQEAQPLNFTWPVVLALLSIPILKQKVKLRSFVALFVSFSGVFVISTRGDIFGLEFSHRDGVLLASGSAFIWALFWLYNLRDRRDEVAKIFLNFLFGFIFSACLVFAVSEEFTAEVEGLAGAVYVGIFEMGVTFVVWLKALKLSKTTAQVSNLIYASPFISLLFIHFIGGEEILFSTFVGLTLIILGIGIQKSGEYI